MMSIPNLLSHPLTQQIAVVLLHFVWQGLVVAAVVALAVKLLRLKPGRQRYAAYLLGLLVMVACPVATFIVLMPQRGPDFDTLFVTEPAPALATAATTELFEIRPLSWRDRASDALPWVTAIWIAGVLLLSARLGLGWMIVQRWRRTRQPLPRELHEQAVALAQKLGLARFSRIFASSRIKQPMALGCWRPMVLLPLALLTQMSAELLEAVIAHELAHIRRRDLWVNLAQRIVETLLFYHPAVWWMSAKIREQRELCCDELAIAATGQRAAYAKALEQTARQQEYVLNPSLAVALRTTHRLLLARVRHVLGMPAQTGGGWSGGLAALALLVIVSTTIGVSCSSPARHAEAASPQVGVEATTVPSDDVAEGEPKSEAETPGVSKTPLLKSLFSEPASHEQIPDRLTMLNNLKRKHEFRLHELQSELREKAVRLSIDGMGTPGRLSTKELELQELLKMQFEIQRRIAEAKAALEQNPEIEAEKIEADARLNRFYEQLDEVDLQLAETALNADHPDIVRMQKRREALLKKIEQRRTELAERYAIAIKETLGKEIQTTEQRLMNLYEKINQTKADLGDLSYAMSQYLTMQEEADETRILLRELTKELDRLGAEANMLPAYSQLEIDKATSEQKEREMKRRRLMMDRQPDERDSTLTITPLESIHGDEVLKVLEKELAKRVEVQRAQQLQLADLQQKLGPDHPQVQQLTQDLNISLVLIEKLRQRIDQDKAKQ